MEVEVTAPSKEEALKKWDHIQKHGALKLDVFMKPATELEPNFVLSPEWSQIEQ